MELIILDDEKISTFIEIFRNLKPMIDLMDIDFTEDGVYSQSMDNNHVSLFEMKFTKDWFDEYSCDQSVTLGVNNVILFSVLNCYDKGHILKIEVGENCDKMDVYFESEDVNILNKHFKIPLFDLNSEKLHVPDAEYSADVKLETARYVNLIDELIKFNDNVRISLNEAEVHFNAEGDIKMNVVMEDFIEYAIEEGESFDVLFSLKYLHWMCSFSKLSPEMDMHFSKELPMKMMYSMGDNFVRFFLAPKMDDY